MFSYVMLMLCLRILRFKCPNTSIIPTLCIIPEKKDHENLRTEFSSRLLPQLSSTSTISEGTSIAEVTNPEIVPTGVYDVQ